MQFSEKLYTLRKERGLTQKQVGEALSMAARQYQRFEVHYGWHLDYWLPYRCGWCYFYKIFS